MLHVHAPLFSRHIWTETCLFWPFHLPRHWLVWKKKFLSHNFSFFCVAASWVTEGTILVLPVPSDGCAHCRAEKARALEFPALTLPLCAFHPQFLDFPFLIFRRCGLDWVLTAPLTASATSRCLWRLFFFLSCSPSVCQLLPCGRCS